MGTPVNDRDDRDLRNLFQEVGGLEAPAGMELRILQRIAVLPQPRVDVNAPLLPKWAWFLVAAVLTGLGALILSSPPGTPDWMPDSNVAAWLGSKWVLGSVVCAATLFGLDHWLGWKRMGSPLPNNS